MTTRHPTFAAGSAVLDQLCTEARLEQLQALINNQHNLNAQLELLNRAVQ